MNKFTLSTFVFCLISIGIVGCASTAPYLEPVNGPTAKLTLIAGEGAKAAIVQAQADNDCQLVKNMAVISENPGRVINLRSDPIVVEKTLSIPAEDPFRIQVFDLRHGARAMYTCKVAAQFNPIPGADYQMVWNWCDMQILHKMTDGKWEKDHTSRRIKYCIN